MTMIKMTMIKMTTNKRCDTGALLRIAASGLATVLLMGASALGHADDAQGVQPASLEVKARIKSMEQVNVTAEKPIDETAPPPSAAVADLLAQLQASDAQVDAADQSAD